MFDLVSFSFSVVTMTERQRYGTVMSLEPLSCTGVWRPWSSWSGGQSHGHPSCVSHVCVIVTSFVASDLNPEWGLNPKKKQQVWVSLLSSQLWLAYFLVCAVPGRGRGRGLVENIHRFVWFYFPQQGVSSGCDTNGLLNFFTPEKD